MRTLIIIPKKKVADAGYAKSISIMCTIIYNYFTGTKTLIYPSRTVRVVEVDQKLKQI